MTHTFEELESLCKKRRLKKYAIIGGVAFGVMIAMGGVVYGVMKIFSIGEKSEVVEVKEVKKAPIIKEAKKEVKEHVVQKEHFNKPPQKEFEEKEHFVKKEFELPSDKEMPSLNEIEKPVKKVKEEVQKVNSKNFVSSRVEENNQNFNKPQIKEERFEERREIRVLKPILDFNIYSSRSMYEEQPKKVYHKVEHKEVQKVEAKKVENSENIISSTELPPFDICIAMANKYYQNKEYKKALEWAKKANLQNKEAPDSWIITAKILYATGNKEKAIRILKIYNEYNPTPSVKALIEKMQKGE